MKKRNLLVSAMVMTLAAGSILLPNFAEAAGQRVGRGAHAGGHLGHGAFHGGGGRRVGGGFRGGRGHGAYYGGNYYGDGGWGGGYYGGFCGPIQLTLGLCGPYGY